MSQFMSPKVSIIVPYFKCEKYLDQCVKSLLRQNHSNIEVILVDDGSEIPAREALSKECSKDVRLKVIRQINRGRSNALNTGLKCLSKDSKYFARVDADDFVEENFITEMLTILENDCSVGTVTCSYRETSEDGVPIRELSSTRLGLKCGILVKERSDKSNTQFISFFSGYGQGAFALHRIDVISNFDGFDENLAVHEDTDFFINMALFSKVVHLNMPLYYYRKHAQQSITNKKLLGECYDKLRCKWDNRRFANFYLDCKISNATWAYYRFVLPARNLVIASKVLVSLVRCRENVEGGLWFIRRLIYDSFLSVIKPLRN